MHTVLVVGPHSAEQSRTIPSPDQLAVLGLMHPRVGLPLLAARAHCWLVFSLLSTRTPKSISELQPLIPQFVCIARVAPSQVQNPALALVKCHNVSDCPAI